MTLRSRILACGLALGGLAGACAVDLEDDLEGEPCTVAEDCWRTQECARTPEEAQFGLPGTCQPEGTGCLFGQQLGCGCNPVDPSSRCLSGPLPVTATSTYPSMVCEPTLLRCTIAPPGGAP